MRNLKIFFLIGFIVFFSLDSIPNHAQAVSLTQAEETWLHEHVSEITFAPLNDYPPFLWSQYGVLFGVSSDYLNYIQENLSIVFKSQEPRTRTEIIKALKSGEMSFVSSMTETFDRSEYLLFTRPYISLPVIFVGKGNMRSITSSDIIEKKLKVSVSRDYAVHSYLEERYPKMLLIPVDNNYKALQNVSSGITEIAAINTASLIYFIQEHDFQDLKKIGETGFNINLAFAVPKSLPELRDIFDKIIESMPEQTKKSILSRWVTNTPLINGLVAETVEPGGASYIGDNNFFLIMIFLLMFCIGFIGHYLFVRYTPRKNKNGEILYEP